MTTIKPGVLIIGNFLSSWHGGTAVCEGLAQRLESEGWRVHTAAHSRPRLQRVSEMLNTAWHTRHEYQVAYVDVYSGPAFAWAEATCTLLHTLGKPYVLALRGGSLPDFVKNWPRMFEYLVQHSAAAVAPSGYLIAKLPRQRSLLRLIPNPVEAGRYPFISRRDAQPKLIWLRAFHEIYNPALAVRVLSLLVPDYPDVTLTMIGPDRGDGSLSTVVQTASELGVAERLTLTGPIPKGAVPQWLNQGDVFLNTTDVDNTPVSVAEAMACGLCVVSTDVGGLPYLLQDEFNALLVPPRNAEAMAAAVRRVLTDARLAGHLSEQGRRTAVTLDWSRILPMWEALLHGAAAYGKLGAHR